jgi:uncharacterized protein
VIELTQINIYPVKSCKGITLTRAELTPFGLKNDRRWMVVDANGLFLSQRAIPRMALIEPTLTDEGLVLNAPNAQILEVPHQSKAKSARSVRVWDDLCEAEDCGDEAAQWFSELLQINSRLVTIGKTFSRSVDAQYARNQDQVSFADAFPLLLISSASLRDLNGRLDLPIPMNRFRPNLVVSGCDPYAEDRWKRFSVGTLSFTVSKPCARCTVPTVDQMTGTKGTEPLATLSTYRKGNDHDVFFGQNLVNEQKSGELVMGMEVTVLD